MTQVFISYSRKDLAFVERLAEDLQAAGLDVWYDLSGLDGGTRWGREIQNSIETSQCFVVVLSPNSIDSEWVEKEFMYANSLKKKIIPLFYQPCKTPMWFINLHFIDVQGENYDRNFWIILKAMGVKAGEGRAKVKPASAVPVTPAAPAPLPQEQAAQEKARQDELARQQRAAEEKQRQEVQERLRKEKEEEEKARQEQLARQQRAAEEKQRQEAEERLRKEEEKARLEQLVREKSAAEEKSRLEAQERLRQKEEIQVRRAALELERSRQEQQKRELHAAEIARLQQEIEAALLGEHWERARLLISQLKKQGPEGQALAGSLRKRLPRIRIPGWVWAAPVLLVLIAFAAWGMPALAARLLPTATSTPTATATSTFTPTLPPSSTPTSTFTPSQTLVPSPTLTPTTGMVSGSVWWADRPFEGVAVDVCSNWLYTCKGVKFSDITKADGSFTIAGVSPGEYQLITRYPGQEAETRYFSGDNLFPLSITVSAGETANVDRINICKTDLYLYAPIINGKVVKFSWKPYPGATDYVLKLSGGNNTWKDSWGTNGLAFETSLNSGNYQITVFVFGPSCTQGIVNFTVP